MLYFRLIWLLLGSVVSIAAIIAMPAKKRKTQPNLNYNYMVKLYILSFYFIIKFYYAFTNLNSQLTLVKSSRIYTGQCTFPILLLNDYNMLGEHKGREKNIVYGRHLKKIHILNFDRRKTWIWRTLGHTRNIFTKWHFHNAWNTAFF